MKEPSVSLSLWLGSEGTKFFLVPDNFILPSGSFPITNRDGTSKSVDLSSVKVFEVSEDEALRWARGELGETLGELRQNIDEKLAEWRRQLDELDQTPITQRSNVTPEAGSTFFDFLTQLPRIISDSVSGDEERVDSARKATAELEQKFNKSGLPVDDRLRNFPDRMARIHESGSTTKK